MPFFLRNRNPNVTEIMDDPNCDRGRLYNTYRQFRYLNAALSRTKAVYRRWLMPAMIDRAHTYTLLDIGFGGGDIPLAVARWAARDGYRIDITGIEVDRRAMDYAERLPAPDNVHFRFASTTQLVLAGERYDFVISNHMLHHLEGGAFTATLDEAAQLGCRFALMVDLQRSDLAYALFSVLTLPLFRDSYIRADGLASLRRSYTFRELQAAAPPGWTARRLFPFRQTLCYRPDPP